MRTRWTAALAVVIVLTLSGCGKDVPPLATQAQPVEVTTTASTPVAAPSNDAETITYASAVHRSQVLGFLQAWHDSEVIAFLDAWHQAELSYVPPAPANAKAMVTTPPPVQKPMRQAQSQVPTTSGGGSPPNNFLACVRNRESHGQYGVVNSSSGAGGAYQFLPSTWHAMGGSGLPQNASPAEQDAMAAKLYASQGRAPWAGPGC